MMSKKIIALVAFFVLLTNSYGVGVFSQEATPEPTENVIISIVPDDDPSAARCEVEIVAQARINSKIIQVLAKITTPTIFTPSEDGSAYASHCLMIALDKQGYEAWDVVPTLQPIIKDDGGAFYVFGTFQLK